MLTIRTEQPGDIDAIRRVHEAAFPTPDEARLVDALRAMGQLLISLVADDGGDVTGHIAFSPVRVGNEGGGVGLAPLAVLPARQGRGIGSRLIREGLEICKHNGYGFVVVLGHPLYYPRFGFVRASTHGLGNEYGAAEAFMVQELRPNGLPKAGGLVRYGPAFAAFGRDENSR